MNDRAGPTGRAWRAALIGSLLMVAPGLRAQEAPAQPPQVHEHLEVALPLLNPSREAAGTAWLPDVTPMYGVHQPLGAWDLRVNGQTFVEGRYEPGDRHRTRGPDRTEGNSSNWGMVVLRRAVGNGRFGIRTMMSAEPWTVRGCGSISFLATGEVCRNDTIHDRQQSHDLVMELAADYEHAFAGGWQCQVYGGLAGEPALGPPGYIHRASAISNPLAPITHHWLEPVPVSYGIITAGMHNRRWKAEFSAFNGRGPNDSRTSVDLGGFDSASGRLSFLPNERWSLQVSAGRLREARSEFPYPSQEPFDRFTASALYYRPLAGQGLWATTVGVGASHGREIVPGALLDAVTTGALLESSVDLATRHTMFGRVELGGLPAHHLHAAEYSTAVFAVAKLQFGCTRHFPSTKGITPGLGTTMAWSLLPAELAPRYSGRVAPSFSVSVIVRAARHQL